MITVKVGKVPGTIREVVLSGECGTVSQALSAASETANGFTITVDGNAAVGTTTVGQGSLVLLSKNIKGN